MNSEGRALFVVVQCAFGCVQMRSPFHYDVLLCSILFNFAGQTEQCQQSPSSCATSPHSPPLWPPVSDRCFMMWLDVMLCIALHSIYWDYWVGAVAVPVRPILNASSEIICLLNPFFVSLGIDIIRVFQDCYSTSSTSYKTRHHFPPNQRLQHLRTGDWVGNLLFRQASSILHIHVPAIKLVSMIAGLIRHLASAKHRGSHTEEYDANHHANEGPELQCRPSKI